MKKYSFILLSATSICLLASCGGDENPTSATPTGVTTGATTQATSGSKGEKLAYFDLVLPTNIKFSVTDKDSYTIKLGDSYLRMDSMNYNFFKKESDDNYIHYHKSSGEGQQWIRRTDLTFERFAHLVSFNLYPRKSDNGYTKGETFTKTISGVTYSGYKYNNVLDSFYYVNNEDFKFIVANDTISGSDEINSFDTTVSEFPIEVPTI